MLRLRARTVTLTVTVAAAILAATWSAPRTSAQPPIPSPPPTGQAVPIPGTASVPPGGRVSFTSPVPTPGPGATVSPGGPGLVRVDNRSDQPATVTYDGLTLTIEVPAEFIPQVQQVQGSGAGNCASTADRPNVVICMPVFSRPAAFLAFTTSPASARSERVELAAGCNNVALTWPVDTSLRTVATAVAPPSALESIFKFDPALGRFRGFSPIAPAFVNDYTAVETRLEAVFICTREAATLSRPQP